MSKIALVSNFLKHYEACRTGMWGIWEPRPMLPSAVYAARMVWNLRKVQS